jgi:hypothetical protein
MPISQADTADKPARDERDAPIALIHDALVAAAKTRRLSPLEIRIRRLTAPLPWRDAGVCRTTWYRRRHRAPRGLIHDGAAE